MTKGSIKNMAASVRQRLLNLAKTTNRPFSEVLQYYALERWLFRLSRSKFRDRFVLKGALLLVVWKLPATRPTRDIDLLGRVSNELELVRSAIVEVCQTQVEDDGLIFNAASVRTQRIAEDADYEGVRATFQGNLGNARVPMQIDIGFSDLITPAAASISYPALLEMPGAELLAYNRETMIAEKFEAMVKLGELNSRMKDFFDISALAANFDFHGPTLAAAIVATFNRRQTKLELDPICFSNRFASEPAKAAQWQAFVRRNLLADSPADFPQVVQQVRQFLQPLVNAVISGDAFNLQWSGGGPWK